MRIAFISSMWKEGLLRVLLDNRLIVIVAILDNLSGFFKDSFISTSNWELVDADLCLLVRFFGGSASVFFGAVGFLGAAPPFALKKLRISDIAMRATAAMKDMEDITFYVVGGLRAQNEDG